VIARHFSRGWGGIFFPVGKGMNSWDGILLRRRLLKKEFPGFSGETTQIGKKNPVSRSVRGQAPGKHLRGIWGMLKTTCRCILITIFDLPHQNFDPGFRRELKSLVLIIEGLADIDP